MYRCIVICVFLLSMIRMLMSIVIMRMMQGNPCKDLSFSLAQIKERKETFTPNKLPPILGSLIDFEQKPLYIKDLVWLASLCPKGRAMII